MVHTFDYDYLPSVGQHCQEAIISNPKLVLVSPDELREKMCRVDRGALQTIEDPSLYGSIK